MIEENAPLRAARERTESGRRAGECLSRQELAELVNAHLRASEGRKVELDGHYVAKLERGVIRWPNEKDVEILALRLCVPESRQCWSGAHRGVAGHCRA